MGDHAGHSIDVNGVWHNDSTAGLAVDCRTCGTEIAYFADGGTTWSELKVLVENATVTIDASVLPLGVEPRPTS